MSNTVHSKPITEHGASSEHIRADRACVGCGFNLFGQPVSKDPHYGLAIARCPECAQVAALQSYPTMSRWVNRFRAVLASVWVIGLLGVFFISTLITLQIVNGAVQLGSDDLAEELGMYHETWSLALAQQQADAAQADGSAPPVSGTINLPTTTVTNAPGGTTTTTINRTPMGMNYSGMFSWGMLSEDWIEQELDSTMMNIGGIWKNLNKEFLAILLPASFFALLLGIFWSITMLGARRRTIIWLVIVAQIIAVVILLAMILIPGSFPRAIDIAKGQALPVVMPIIMGAQLIFALLGVYLGRKMARFVICMSLPPRYRTSLSIFWSRDGLELPKPTLP